MDLGRPELEKLPRQPKQHIVLCSIHSHSVEVVMKSDEDSKVVQSRIHTSIRAGRFPATNIVEDIEVQRQDVGTSKKRKCWKSAQHVILHPLFVSLIFCGAMMYVRKETLHA